MELGEEFQSRSQDLILCIHPNGLAEFRINRPKALNALSHELLLEMYRLLILIEPIAEIPVVLLWSGNPKAFSAGGDIVEMIKIRVDSFQLDKYPSKIEDVLTPSQPLSNAIRSNIEIEQQLVSGHLSLQDIDNEIKANLIPAVPNHETTLWQRDHFATLMSVFYSEYSLFYYISTYSKPTIALISGYAMGGGLGLAMSCSVRLCALNSTRISMPETKIGLFPDVGASYFFRSNTFGLPAARFLGCTGYTMNSAELLQLGLVDGVFLDEQYNNVVSALKAVPALTLQSHFTANKLPPILIQETNIPVTHPDSLCLLQQTHKYQLLSFLLFLSTFVSPPRPDRPHALRLGIYLSQHQTFIAGGANSQTIYKTIATEIQTKLCESFLFRNIGYLLEWFKEPSYYLCIENLLSVSTNKVTVRHGEKAKTCAQDLITMLSPLCPMSCIITYQMFSPFFSRIITLHKQALFAPNLNAAIPNSSAFTARYHQYVLDANPSYATTPMVVNRAIQVLHLQPFHQFVRQQPSAVTSISCSSAAAAIQAPTAAPPNLTYRDYLNTEFNLVARMSSGSFSNYNFISGINSALIARHKSPKWHSFNDILDKYTYFLNEYYSMDMQRSLHILDADDKRLFQEECLLLLYTTPLNYKMPQMTDYAVFQFGTPPQLLHDDVAIEAKL